MNVLAPKGAFFSLSYNALSAFEFVNLQKKAPIKGAWIMS